MNQSIKGAITNILNKFDATEDEKSFVEFANTVVMSEINYSRVISQFILIKQLQHSTKQLIESNKLLTDQLNQSTEKIIISNKNLAEAEDKSSKKMVFLTWALVFVGLLQAISALFSLFKGNA